MDLKQYKELGKVFSYPTDELKAVSPLLQSVLNDDNPEAAAEMQLFTDFVEATPLDAIEEVYTKTFHIQAICYLDLGYVMFGEDYKRGEFLSNMKREQELAGNDCGAELPDNLANVLSLLPLIQDEDFLNELIKKILIPSVRKMLDEFKSSRMELKLKVLRKKHKAILQEDLPYGNIYQFPLRALLRALEHDFAHIMMDEAEPAPVYGNFLKNCGTGCSVTPNQFKTIKS